MIMIVNDLQAVPITGTWEGGIFLPVHCCALFSQLRSNSSMSLNVFLLVLVFVLRINLNFLFFMLMFGPPLSYGF